MTFLRHIFGSKTALGLCWVLVFPLVAGAQGGGKSKSNSKSEQLETKELFRVSRVGQRSFAESRELLVTLYQEIAAEHDAGVRRETAGQKVEYVGEKVKVLRKLDGGSRYLCVYEGGLSVFHLSEGSLLPGQTSPALKVNSRPDEVVELTKVIKVPAPGAAASSAPSLETIDGDEEEITFFGIPLVRSEPTTEASGGWIEKEIAETKILPGFQATISDELLNEPPPMMSQALLLKTLKNGGIYTVERKEMRRCQECRGFSRIQDTVNPPGKRDPDGKMDCPECRALGKRQWDVTYKVTW